MHSSREGLDLLGSHFELDRFQASRGPDQLGGANLTARVVETCQLWNELSEPSASNWCYRPNRERRVGDLFGSAEPASKSHLKSWMRPRKHVDLSGTDALPIEHSRLFVYDRPHLYPLARLIDQYPRYAVVLADTNAAKIFVFALGQAVQRREVQNVKTNRTQVGGWSQMRYQRHTENYHLHHAKEVIDNLDRLVRDERIEYVVLAGDEQVIIPLLREQMSKELSEKVVDVLSLGIDTPEHELLEESLNAYRRHNALSDMDKVEHLIGEYRRDGLAVAGVAQTLAALSNGQVEELLIASSPDALKFDKAEVEKVLAAYGETGQQNTTPDQRTVADELLRRATQLSSAQITFIEDNSVLKNVGGVGALIRYRVSAENAAPYEQGKAVSTAEAMIKLDSSMKEDENVGQGSTKERSQAQGQR